MEPEADLGYPATQEDGRSNKSDDRGEHAFEEEAQFNWRLEERKNRHCESIKDQLSVISVN